MLLSKMRSGIFSYLFLGFLLMGGAGLVMMDWTGSYRNGGGSHDVAVVGGERISAVAFDRMARRVARSQNLDTHTAYQAGVMDQILQLQIMDILMQKAAFDNGVVVADKEVAKKVNTMIEPMAGKDGDKKAVLRQVLQSQGMSEGELVDNLRGDMTRGVLRDSISQNYYVPAVLAKDLYGYQHETRSVDTVLISMDSFKAPEPDDVDLNNYFNSIKDQYTEPESRSFTVAVISPDTLIKDSVVTDDDVKKFYDQNQDNFRAEEQRMLEQAVVDSEDKAKAIAKAATDGKSLQDAVKSVTGDTKAFSAESGYEKAGLPAQLADPIFKAESGSVVGPVKSPLGWHVVTVKKVQAAQVQPFDSVKDTIRKELLHDKKADDVFAATTSLEDRLAGGESFDALSKDTPLTLVPVKDVRLSMKDVPALKGYDKDEETIIQTAFKLKNGETSPLADLSNGKMFTVRLDKLTPKRQKDLKEVKSDVISRWKLDYSKKASAGYAAKSLQKLEKKETTLEAIAKERGVKIQSFSGLNRAKPAPTGLTDGNLQQVMSAPKNEDLVMPTAKGILIGRVTSVKAFDKDPTAAEVADTREKLGKDTSQENLLSFVDALQVKYKTVTNPELLQQMYGDTPEEGQ